ncbi:MAG: metallophosphoesterase [Candidatus Levybacteria bacterium CG10_big_fil_rev_8_21_14_0_10_36_7]|nr:MAG: metallophosphoesterase [Candidatus Levybacteria bacterium CG10_big_fil_rev_8_21_14_0_10_36_7]
MKIAFISDIHSNNLGLETVLSAMGTVDSIYCIGDITGYYPFPNEVIEEMKARNIISVMGNHDKYILQGFAPEKANEQVLKSVEFTKKIISEESLNYVKSLPEKIEATIDGKKVLICHGSPWDNLEERIYPNFPNFEKFENIEQDIIVLGHTHYPMVVEIGGKIIVNPGSCGQPRDYNLLSYIIWDTTSNLFDIKRVGWDIKRFKKESVKKGVDSKLFEVFSRRK